MNDDDVNEVAKVVTIGVCLVILAFGMAVITVKSYDATHDGEYIEVKWEINEQLGSGTEVHRKSDEVHEVAFLDGGQFKENHEFHRLENSTDRVGVYTVVALNESGHELERAEPERGERE